MKQCILPIVLVMSAMTGVACANQVTIDNASDSVSPINVTYLVAHQQSGKHAVHYSSSHQVTLAPGKKLHVGVPQAGSGVMVTQLSFVTQSGRQITKSFDKSTFGKVMSCSFVTTQAHPDGQLKLALGKHNLTCQHS